MITRSPSVNRTSYNREIHHRRSVRLKGYDYSLAGAYFVTICTQNRECMFGKIHNAKMILNDAGRMVEWWWEKLNDKFENIETDAFVVMPNHFHGIILIQNDIVGADPCVCPEPKPGAHTGAPLHTVIQWFKTMTTNDYIRGIKQRRWPPFEKRLWQRNYYERVVRDDPEMHRVREYVTGNPAGWLEDEENPIRHS